GQPGQLELGALRLGLAGVADELYRSRPLGDVDQTLLVAGLHEEEGTIQTHHTVKQIGLEAQLDVLDLLGLEGGVAGGTEVPATGHGGTAGLGIEEQVIGGLVIHADDPRRVLELGILGALAGAVGNVAIRGGDLAAGLGDAGLAGLGVLAEDLGLTLVEGVAETQGAAQVLGERVVGLGKGAVGGVVVHGVVGAERRADQRQGEVGAGGNLANAFQRQLHVAATEAVDGEVAAVFLEVVKAGDPVEIIVEVAAQLELLADLVLIPLAVEGQQLHRGAVQIHGAGRGCFPVGGDGFEVDFAEGDIDVEVDALAFVGGAGLGQAGVRRIGVDGGIVGVPVGVAELLLAEEIGGIEADAVGDDAGKAVGAGGVECHQLGALPAVLEVAPVKAQGGIEVLVHGLPADLAAGVGILVDVASFLVETVEEEAVGIGVGAVIAETVAIVVAHGEARGELLADDGQVHHRLDLAVLVVADFALDVAFQLAGGVIGLDVEGAAGGVAAKQRTLGAAQHFRLGDIEHVDVTAGGAGQVDAVDVGGDRGIGAAAGGNLGVAANGHEDQRGGAGAAGHDGQAGGGALQIGQLRYLGLGQ